jgi:hypothetical protein
LMMQGNTSITRSPVFLAVLHWTSIEIIFLMCWHYSPCHLQNSSQSHIF